MGVKVLKRIDRNFEPYAVAIHFSGKHAKELEFTWTDGGHQIWLSRRNALQLAGDIYKRLEIK